MAKHSKLQIALEYSLARVILSGLGALPRRAAITVGIGIGRLVYLLPGNLRRTGERNLEIAFPNMDQRERERLLRGCF
jgi:KDO2-lipid IV(A) lauroyltransferase